MRFPLPGLARPLLVMAAVLPALAAASALAQNFAQPKVVPATSWPHNFYAGDFDGDGNQDLLYLQPIPNAAAGQPDTTVQVAYGDGKGNFSAPITWGQIAASGGVLGTVADMNADGIQDFIFVLGPVAPSREATYAVWFGNAQRSQPLTSSSMWLPTGTGTFSSIVVAQFNHTNVPSLFVFDTSGNGEIFSLNGFGAFQPYFTMQLPGGVGPVAAYDLNGDGNLDLVVLSQTSHAVDVYLGTGYAPPFQGATRYTGVSGAYSMLLANVDQDSHPDLVIEGANGRFDIFHGNTDGTFSTTSEGGSLKLDGTTGNGGHLIGLTTVGGGVRHNFYTATPAGISALIGQGNLTYLLNGIYNAGPGRTSYALADFNKDGYPDLAVDSPEGIAILFGNADGSFQTSQAFAAGQPALSHFLGKFTSSGNVDAVVSTASMQAQFLRGNGDGTFTASPAPTTTQTGIPGLWSVVTGGDFNGDGKLDIALTADGPSPNFTTGAGIPYTSELPTPPSGLNIQYGNGDGTFQPPVGVTGPLGLQQTAGSPASFYGVSIPTGIFGGTALLNRDASAYRYFGEINHAQTSGQFGYQTTYTLHPHNLVVSGFLRPGIEDVIEQQEGDLFEFQNDGKQLATSLGTLPVGDLAVDGSLTTPGQLVAPEIDPSFNRVSTTLGFKAFPGSATIADLDGDGNGDLIVAYANLSANLQAPVASAPNYIYIWFGSGNGKFLTSAKHPVNPVRFTPSRNFYQVAVADLNGDNIPDLILSDGYILSVQLGKGDGTFGAETHYLAGQGINSISLADINHDGTPDLVLANGGTVLSNPVTNLETLATNPDVNTGGITVLLNHALALPVPGGTVAAAPEPSTYGSAFSLTATFAASQTPAPTGTVIFSVDGTAVGTAPVSGLVATLTGPATLNAGTHTLTAAYSGDANYAPTTFTGTHAIVQSTTSLHLLLCVDPPGSLFPCGNPITATPLISPITFYFGQSLDGVVTESATNLTGTITFYSGTSIFCTLSANLAGGSNTCPPASGYFPPGTTNVYATYSGDVNNTAATSNSIVVTVFPDITTAAVTSSLNPALVGQSVTFTAAVTGNFATPTGPVLFLDGTTQIGSATLDATGHATLTTSTLAAGTHPITVVLPGSADFNPATSPVLNQVINPLGPQSFILTVTPVPVTVGVGRTAVLLVTIAGINGFNQPVKLGCVNLAPETSCTFVQPTIQGAGSTTLYLSTSAPRACGTNTPYFVGSLTNPGRTAAALFACLLMLPAFRRRRLVTRTILVSLLTLSGLAALSGCGNCTDLGTRPGTYSFTVTGTAASETASQTIQLTTTIP
jgi:hypothetical protein